MTPFADATCALPPHCCHLLATTPAAPNMHHHPQCPRMMPLTSATCPPAKAFPRRHPHHSRTPQMMPFAGATRVRHLLVTAHEHETVRRRHLHPPPPPRSSYQHHYTPPRTLGSLRNTTPTPKGAPLRCPRTTSFVGASTPTLPAHCL